MTDIPSRPTGVLLAGGQSRRMFALARDGAAAAGPGEPGAGQGDKGLLAIAGRPMLAHVIERLAPQVGRMVINANGDPARFAPFGLPVVADTIEGFVGPLAGVLAGMRWSARQAPEAEAIVTVSTDAPFLPSDLVARLTAAAAEKRHATAHPIARPIAMARSGGELHPVIALWSVALADDLEAALRDGVRKVLRWTDRHGTLPVEFPFQRIGGRMIDPFFNANTPEELDEARALLETRHSDQ